MKALIILLLSASAAIAGGYDDHFDKDGTKQNYGDYYEDIRKNDGNYTDLLKNLAPNEKDGVVIYDEGTIPKATVDVWGNEKKSEGVNLGSSVRGSVGSEKALRNNAMNPLQNETEMTTLGDTYICSKDNETYGDASVCSSECGIPCDKYLFKGSVTCQTSFELIRVTPAHLGVNPPFTVTFDGKSYSTPPVTASCVNGFMSGTDKYAWQIIPGTALWLKVDDQKYLGECKDLKDRDMISSFMLYYEYMGVGLTANASKVGYVVASPVRNPDMSLSITAIKAGLCDGNALITGIPNAGLIHSAPEKGISIADAQAVADSDPIYKLLTSNSNYSETSCQIKNNVRLVTEEKLLYATDIFTGSLPDVTNCNRNNETHVSNLGTVAFLDQGDSRQSRVDFTDKLTGRYLSSEMEILGYLNFNSGRLTGCYGVPQILAQNESCKIENKCIKSDVDIKFAVSVERKSYEDIFNISTADNCGAKKSGCDLNDESVCDMNGLNCIDTMVNGVKTNAKVGKICTEISTSLDSYLVCSDGKNITATGKNKSFVKPGGHFTIKRGYTCADKKPDDYDYTGFQEQSREVLSSAKMEDNGDYTFKYIDRDGNVKGLSTNITVSNPDCAKTCKVTVPAKPDPDKIVLAGGETAPKVLEPTYRYKECTPKDNTWVCEPDYAAGESMIEGCSCPDDFVETVVKMKFIDEASKDMKCSTK